MPCIMFNRILVTLSVLSIAALGCNSEEPSENTSETTASSTTEATTDSEAGDQTVVGGYSKAAVDEPKVTAAAEFAVTEESKKGTKISLKSISSAETQVVAGTNYKLVIVINADGAEKTAEVVVYEDLQQSMSVTSWTTK